MKAESNVTRLKTTVGDLVVAMVDAALRAGGSERNAYRLTGLILNAMLEPVPVRAARSPRSRYITRRAGSGENY
jgi:hypothetical protein